MNQYPKGASRPTAKAVVVGNDVERHQKEVNATGVKIPKGSTLDDKMEGRNVSVHVTGMKKGTADKVNAVGFDFQ